jgi:zinc D-Ala-D-Ala carboxypeptidase
MALNNLKPVNPLAQNIPNINTAKNPMNVGANSIGTTTSARQKLLDQSNLTKNTDGISRFSAKTNERLEGNNFDILGRKIEASNNVLPFQRKDQFTQVNNPKIDSVTQRLHDLDIARTGGILFDNVGTGLISPKNAIGVGQQSNSGGSRQQQVAKEINSKKQEVLASTTTQKQSLAEQNLTQKQAVIEKREIPSRDIPKPVGQSDNQTTISNPILDSAQDAPDISVKQGSSGNEREAVAILDAQEHVSAQDIAKAFKVHCLSKGNLKTVFDSRGRLALVDKSPELYEFFIEISTEPEHKKVYDYLLSTRDLINRKKLFGFYIKTLNSAINNEPNKFANVVSLNYQRPSSGYTEGKSLYFYFNVDAGKCSPSVANIVTKGLVWYDRHPSNTEDAVPVEVKKLNVYYKQVKGIYFNSKESYLKAYPEQGNESQDASSSKAVADEGRLSEQNPIETTEQKVGKESVKIAEEIQRGEIHEGKQPEKAIAIGASSLKPNVIGIGQGQESIGVGVKERVEQIGSKHEFQVHSTPEIRNKISTVGVGALAVGTKLGSGVLVGTKAGAALSVGAGALASGGAAAVGSSGQGIRGVTGGAINAYQSGGFQQQAAIGVSPINNIVPFKRGLSVAKNNIVPFNRSGQTILAGYEGLGQENKVLVFASNDEEQRLLVGDQPNFNNITPIKLLDDGTPDWSRISASGKASLARASSGKLSKSPRTNQKYSSNQRIGNSLKTGSGFTGIGGSGNGGGGRRRLAPGSSLPDDENNSDDYIQGEFVNNENVDGQLALPDGDIINTDIVGEDGNPEVFDAKQLELLKLKNGSNRLNPNDKAEFSNIRNRVNPIKRNAVGESQRNQRQGKNAYGRDLTREQLDSVKNKVIGNLVKNFAKTYVAPVGLAILGVVPYILLGAFFVGLLMVIVIAPYCKPSTPIAPGVTLKSFRDNPLEPAALTFDAIGGNQTPLETAGKVAQLGFNISPAGLIVNAVTGGSVLPSSRLRKAIEALPGCDNPASLCATSGAGDNSTGTSGSSINLENLCQTAKDFLEPFMEQQIRFEGWKGGRGKADDVPNRCNNPGNINPTTSKLALVETKFGADSYKLNQPECKSNNNFHVWFKTPEAGLYYYQLFLVDNLAAPKAPYDKATTIGQWLDTYCPPSDNCDPNYKENVLSKTKINGQKATASTTMTEIKKTLECALVSISYSLSKTAYLDTRQQDQTNKYWSEAFGFPVLAKVGEQIKNPVLTGFQVLDARILAFNKVMGGKISVEASKENPTNSATGGTALGNNTIPTDKIAQLKKYESENKITYALNFSKASDQATKGSLNIATVDFILALANSSDFKSIEYTAINSGNHDGVGHGNGVALDIDAMVTADGKRVGIQQAFNDGYSTATYATVVKLGNLMDSIGVRKVLTDNKFLKALPTNGKFVHYPNHYHHYHVEINQDGAISSGSSSGSDGCDCQDGSTRGVSLQSNITGGAYTNNNITNKDASQKYMATAESQAKWDKLQSPIIAIIHYTASKNAPFDTLAGLFKDAISKGPGNSGNQGWAHYMIDKGGASSQFMTEDRKVSGSSKLTGGYYQGNTRLNVNDHALQYEVHYDAGYQNQKIDDKQLESLAKTIVKSGLKAEQIYTHWAVQPWDRSDAKDWMPPSGEVTPEMVKFVKYAGWAKDDTEAAKIGKQIMKQNLENAIKVFGDGDNIITEGQKNVDAITDAAKKLEAQKTLNGAKASKNDPENKLEDLKSALQKINSTTSFFNFPNIFGGIKASATTLEEVLTEGKKRGYTEELTLSASEESALIGIGGNQNSRLIAEAATKFKEMKTAAQKESIEIFSESAFRNVTDQTGIVNGKIGKGFTAEKILSASAPPGLSQHQTGRAVDILTPGADLTKESFGPTKASKWLTTNAVKFGFSLTYPEGNTAGANFEPWHYFYFKGYPNYDQASGKRLGGPKESGASNTSESKSSVDCNKPCSKSDTATASSSSSSSSSKSTSFFSIFDLIKINAAADTEKEILAKKIDEVKTAALSAEEKAFLDVIANQEEGIYANLKPVGADNNKGKYQIGEGDRADSNNALKVAGYSYVTKPEDWTPENQDYLAIGRTLRNAQRTDNKEDKKSDKRKLSEILKDVDGFNKALGFASMEFQALPEVPGYTHSGKIGQPNKNFTIEVAKKFYIQRLALYGGASAGSTDCVSSPSSNLSNSELAPKIEELIKAGKLTGDTLKGDAGSAEPPLLEAVKSGKVKPQTVKVLIALSEKIGPIDVMSVVRGDSQRFHPNGIAIDLGGVTYKGQKYSHTQQFSGDKNAQDAWFGVAKVLKDTGLVRQIISSGSLVEKLRSTDGFKAESQKGSPANIRIATTSGDSPTARHEDHFHIDMLE